MKPVLPATDLVTPSLSKIYESGIYANFGPLSRELEARYAEWFGVGIRQVVSCSNATIGLAGALLVVGQGAVITPSYTFAATLHAVLASRRGLVLADVNDESAIEISHLTAGIAADMTVCVVDPFGYPLDLEAYLGQSSAVIDSAASVLGCQGRFEHLPPKWAAVISLHATKILGCGEGGMAVFGSEEAAYEFRRWTNFGFDGERVAQFPAINGKLSEFHAAWAIAAFDARINEIRRWRYASQILLDHIGGLGLRTLGVNPAAPTPYAVIETRSGAEASQLERIAQRHAIETRRWWPAAAHQQPAFSSCHRLTSLETAELKAASHVGIPIFRDLTSQEALRIRKMLEEFRSLQESGR